MLFLKLFAVFCLLIVDVYGPSPSREVFYIVVNVLLHLFVCVTCVFTAFQYDEVKDKILRQAFFFLAVLYFPLFFPALLHSTWGFLHVATILIFILTSIFTPFKKVIHFILKTPKIKEKNDSLPFTYSFRRTLFLTTTKKIKEKELKRQSKEYFTYYILLMLINFADLEKQSKKDTVMELVLSLPGQTKRTAQKIIATLRSDTTLFLVGIYVFAYLITVFEKDKRNNFIFKNELTDELLYAFTLFIRLARLSYLSTSKRFLGLSAEEFQSYALSHLLKYYEYIKMDNLLDARNELANDICLENKLAFGEEEINKKAVSLYIDIWAKGYISAFKTVYEEYKGVG